MSAWIELVDSNGSDEHLELCDRALIEVRRVHAARIRNRVALMVGGGPYEAGVLAIFDAAIDSLGDR